MIEAPLPPDHPAGPTGSPWRDIAAVIGTTAASFFIAGYFNLNEFLFALTRHGERFQVDELPIGMLALFVGLLWLAWRRYRQARREIRARRAAEARLAAVLEENRRLARENLRIQEVERKHLARELHDELGQYLNAIKLDAVAIREHAALDADASVDAAHAIIRTVDHVHAAVGHMIARLRPVALDELGLPAALEHCVDHWRQRLPDTQFRLTLRGNLDDLGEPLNLTLYRLTQEGLTNIYKHSGAREAEITVTRSACARSGRDELCLTVTDDGAGMDTTPRLSRFGLSGMRERVEMAGGTFMLESSPGRGLRFEAHLPADAGR